MSAAAGARREPIETDVLLDDLERERCSVRREVEAMHAGSRAMKHAISRLRAYIGELDAEADGVPVQPEATRGVGTVFETTELDTFTGLQALSKSLADCVDDLGLQRDALERSMRSVRAGLTRQTRQHRRLRHAVGVPGIAVLVVVRAGTCYAIPLDAVEAVVHSARSWREGEQRRIEIRPSAVPGDGDETLVLVRDAGETGAVVVDSVRGRFEAPLAARPAPLAAVRNVCGVVAVPDGEAALLLDVTALLRGDGMTDPAPVPTTEVEDDPAPVPTSEVDDGRVTLVLVVDDSRTQRTVTERALRRHQMEVRTAKDGLDALESMRELKPDVVLLDIEMPRMNGFEAAREMRADPDLRDVPILIISSRSGDKHVQEAELIGVDGFLGKPFDEPELVESIARIVAQYRAAPRPASHTGRDDVPLREANA